MKQSIVHIALVVRDYDEAVEPYTNKRYLTTLLERQIEILRFVQGCLFLFSRTVS